MHLDAPYFSILLCLMPDDFAYQVESGATQWVNLIYLCTTEISTTTTTTTTTTTKHDS